MRHPARLLAILLAPVLLGPAACVTETRPADPARHREESSRARTAPAARPANVEPQQMMLSAGVGQDTDGNGFPDTIPVVVYLFGDSDRYALPLHEPGTFEFVLTGAAGETLGRWTFPPEEAGRAVGQSPAGLCYRFALRMAPGRDRVPAQPASLRAIFTNAETGRRVSSQGAATIRVGMGE